MSDSTTFPMTNFIKLSLSLMVALVLISVFVGIYGWWVSPQLKSDGNAENVMEELVKLIEAQEGNEWSVETFVRFPGIEYSLVGFSGKSVADLEPPENCENCICVFKVEEKQHERISCKEIKYSLRGVTWIQVQTDPDDRTDYDQGPGSSSGSAGSSKFVFFEPSKNIDDGFMIRNTRIATGQETICTVYRLLASDGKITVQSPCDPINPLGGGW